MFGKTIKLSKSKNDVLAHSTKDPIWKLLNVLAAVTKWLPFNPVILDVIIVELSWHALTKGVIGKLNGSMTDTAIELW